MIVSQELHSHQWEKWGRGRSWENGYTLTTHLEEQEGELLLLTSRFWLNYYP